MTARDLGGIASKSLAVYLGVQAVQYGSMTAFLLQPAQRFASRRPNPDWPNYAIPAIIFATGAIALWLAARRFWPNDVEHESTIQIDQLKRLAFALLGAYFLIVFGGPAILDVINSYETTAFNRPPQNPRWIVDCGVALIGLTLLIVSRKKQPVPGFDDFR